VKKTSDRWNIPYYVYIYIYILCVIIYIMGWTMGYWVIHGLRTTDPIRGMHIQVWGRHSMALSTQFPPTGWLPPATPKNTGFGAFYASPFGNGWNSCSLAETCLKHLRNMDVYIYICSCLNIYT
jgi:hypothetical protein